MHYETAGNAGEYHSTYGYCAGDEIEPPGLRGLRRSKKAECEPYCKAESHHQEIGSLPVLYRNKHIHRRSHNQAEEKGPGQHRVLAQSPGHHLCEREYAYHYSQAEREQEGAVYALPEFFETALEKGFPG